MIDRVKALTEVPCCVFYCLQQRKYHLIQSHTMFQVCQLVVFYVHFKLDKYLSSYEKQTGLATPELPKLLEEESSAQVQFKPSLFVIIFRSAQMFSDEKCSFSFLCPTFICFSRSSVILSPLGLHPSSSALQHPDWESAPTPAYGPQSRTHSGKGAHTALHIKG